MEALEAALAASHAYVSALEAHVRRCESKEAEITARMEALRARVRERQKAILEAEFHAMTARRQSYSKPAASYKPERAKAGVKKRILSASKDKRSVYFQVPCKRVLGGHVMLYYTNPDVRNLVAVQQRYPEPEHMHLRKWKASESNALKKALATHGTGPYIDWSRIRSTAQLTDRTPRACQLRHAMLQEEAHEKKHPWTAKEDALLQTLAAQSHDWQLIARTLANAHGFPPRQPVSCLIRYQTHFNPHLFNSHWTPEEDELLKETLAGMTSNDHNVWRLVAEKMAIGHTPDQCGYRWRNHLSPEVKLGTFSVEDDRRLFLAVYLVSGPTVGMTDMPDGDWLRVKEFLPGRTNVMCSQRFRESLNPHKNNDPFTPDEDAIIAHGVEQFGTANWSAIAPLLPGRFPGQIRKRWMAIKKQFAHVAAPPAARANPKALSVVSALHRTTRHNSSAPDEVILI
ncbi:myb transcription factor [Achlya hypogyna]|uniref:Myb transcription factor n=1 Tax=Achlya hypogyna TaxID=1202772 RepID=A0A1V9ZU88_ACHHY|nr:myb transcription factor [Achlya hypogyna]